MIKTKEKNKEIVLYKNKLEVLAQQLCYYAVTTQAYDILESRGFTNDSITKLNLILFFFAYKTDKVELLIRFTADLRSSDTSTEEIIFLIDDSTIVNLIIEKYFNKDLGVYQQYAYSFDKPNPLQLLDGQFALQHLLGQ